jgi:hypothetical protein
MKLTKEVQGMRNRIKKIEESKEYQSYLKSCEAEADRLSRLHNTDILYMI